MAKSTFVAEVNFKMRLVTLPHNSGPKLAVGQ